MARDDFIAKYRPAAEAIEKETGIPAARIIAQAGHETGWNVNAPGMNFFGIKAQPGYEGKHQMLDTTEDFGNGLQNVKQRFRVYDTPEDSFRDWAKLMQSDRYKAAMRPGIPDNEYAQALQDGGYATDKQYASKLSQVIADTRQAMGQPFSTHIFGAAPGDNTPSVPLVSAADAAKTQIPASGVPDAAGAVARSQPFSLDGTVRNGLALMAAGQPPALQQMQPMQAPPVYRPQQQQPGSLMGLVFGKRTPFG